MCIVSLYSLYKKEKFTDMYLFTDGGILMMSLTKVLELRTRREGMKANTKFNVRGSLIRKLRGLDSLATV